MDNELYAIVAMGARYFFSGLMVLIVFRAWRITVVDNRRARLIRAWSPETGCIGEFVLDPGVAKKAVSMPIPREGVLGSSRAADISIRHRDVRRIHLSFEQREGGLLVRPRGRAPVVLNKTDAGEELFVRDGDTLMLGKLKLLLVLFDPADKREDDAFSDEALWGAPDEPETPAVPVKTAFRRPAVKRTAAEQPAPPPRRPAVRPKKKSSGRAPATPLEAFEDELWPDE